MKKTFFQVTGAAAVALLFASCSSLVKADRSKIPDDLYHPTPSDAGAGGSSPDASSDDASEAGEGGDVSEDAGDAGEVEGTDTLMDVIPADVTLGDASNSG